MLAAVLNSRDHFALPTWSPIANNLVVIGAAVVFVALPGPVQLVPGEMTAAQVAVLGLGTLAGVIAQTAALLPALCASPPTVEA